MFSAMSECILQIHMVKLNCLKSNANRQGALEDGYVTRKLGPSLVFVLDETITSKVQCIKIWPLPGI